MATEEPFFGRKENIKAIWNEIQQVNSTGLVCSKYGFFSKSGYKEIDESFKKQLILYKLEDLYQEQNLHHVLQIILQTYLEWALTDKK